MKDEKKTISGLKRFPAKSYKKIDLDRLAVYALYVLEKNRVPLYFDYIAVAMFRLFPKKFSMANFSKYPDTNRINKAIRRLTDQTRKSWATGSVENGFNLTGLGKEIGKQVLDLLNNPEKQSSSRVQPPTRSRGRSPAVETAEIKKSEAFKKWCSGEVISNYEFFAFLKATPYTHKPMLSEHLRKLKKVALTVGDDEVIDFLKWLENKFVNLLK
jgi:hypothetical protein